MKKFIASKLFRELALDMINLGSTKKEFIFAMMALKFSSFWTNFLFLAYYILKFLKIHIDLIF